MKKTILAILLLTSVGSLALAKNGPSRPFTCAGEDSSGTAKARIHGQVAEKTAYGRTFLVGDYTFEIKEHNKSLFTATMKVAIDDKEHVEVIGYQPMFIDESSVFDLGPFAMAGKFGFWSPDGKDGYQFTVKCKGLYK